MRQYISKKFINKCKIISIKLSSNNNKWCIKVDKEIKDSINITIEDSLKIEIDHSQEVDIDKILIIIIIIHLLNIIITEIQIAKNIIKITTIITVATIIIP